MLVCCFYVEKLHDSVMIVAEMKKAITYGVKEDCRENLHII